MAVLSLRQLAEILSAHIDKRAQVPSQPTALTFTYWQLIWLMDSCGLGLSEKTTEQAQLLIQTTAAQSQLEHIQLVLMRLQGLPESSQRGFKFAPQSVITEILKIVNPTNDPTSDEDDLFHVLQILGGLTPEQQPAVKKLINLEHSQVMRARLSVVRTQEAENWIPADEIDSLIRANLVDKFVDRLDEIRVVTLNPPIQTPMSWALEQPEENRGTLVFLGWPHGSQSSLTRQEQRALFAHELCHIRQILQDTNNAKESNTPSPTLFEREHEALRCEWKELQVQISPLAAKEQARLKQRWWHANFSKQFLSLIEDLQTLAAAKTAIREEGHINPTTQPTNVGLSSAGKGQLPQVRLPFITILYALAAQMITTEHEQN